MIKPNTTDVDRPLEGLIVLDFSQFLSGPSAALRLSDLGARVIKVERTGSGDICRSLYISNLSLDGDSTLFHSINRNKESFAVDLKQEADREQIRALILQADVMMENFRPGVMQRLGLDYETVRQWHPSLVYGQITGYGEDGPWRGKPGQDLLVQSLSGAAFLNGRAFDRPIPLGLALADMAAGMHLAQGILACLVRRGISGEGALVQASLLESMLDFQLQPFTRFLNGEAGDPAGADDAVAPAIYATGDGYLAIASGEHDRLAQAVGVSAELMTASRLAERLRLRSAAAWEAELTASEVTACAVMDWRQLLAHPAFTTLEFTQRVRRSSGAQMLTTRCPIRIDGQRYYSEKGSPRVGEHNEALEQAFNLPVSDRQSGKEAT